MVQAAESFGWGGDSARLGARQHPAHKLANNPPQSSRSPAASCILGHSPIVVSFAQRSLPSSSPRALSAPKRPAPLKLVPPQQKLNTHCSSMI